MSSTLNQVKYDELQSISKALNGESEAFQQLHASTRSKVDALRSQWVGEAAKAFFHEQDGTLLPAVQRVSKALLDAHSVLDQIMKIVHDADAETATYFRGIGGEDTTSKPTDTEQARQKIQEKWNNMDLDARKKWLGEWYKKLCGKLGISPVEFKVEDLPDPVDGDYRGVYNPGIIFGWFSSMTVDIDNVKGNDPFQVLETVGHETRHEYQHYLVDHPDKRPDNISEEQIKRWKENFGDYKKPEDDPPGYWNQPIEVDARDAGERAVIDYLDSGKEVI